MKFPPPPRPVTTIWDEHLSFIVDKPQGQKLNWHKAIFWSAIVAFIEYQKKSFPDKKVISAQDKKIYTAQLQKIYDDASKELADLVEGAK